jgi:ABC-type multidrug transport system permease subunit
VVDPLTYATQVCRAVIMQGFISTGQLVTDFSILIVFTAILIVIGFKTFKPTIE